MTCPRTTVPPNTKKIAIYSEQKFLKFWANFYFLIHSVEIIDTKEFLTNTLLQVS